MKIALKDGGGRYKSGVNGVKIAVSFQSGKECGIAC